LIVASTKGYQSIVELLLDFTGSDHIRIDAKDNGGWTALHWACEHGHINIVKLLLKHKAGINIQDRVGYMSLHWAAENKHANIIAFLLQNNANITAVSVNGTSVMHKIAQRGDLESANVVISHFRRDVKLIKLLVNFSDKWGITPLMTAVRYGHSSMVSLLVDNGADINSYTNIGKWTAIFYACLHGNIELTKQLISFGATITEVDLTGRTPMHILAENGDRNVALLSYLLDIGADLSRDDQEGLTPVELALKRGQSRAHAFLSQYVQRNGREQKLSSDL
jgi:ankyrin repeat protein